MIIKIRCQLVSSIPITAVWAAGGPESKYSIPTPTVFPSAPSVCLYHVAAASGSEPTPPRAKCREPVPRAEAKNQEPRDRKDQVAMPERG